MKPWRKTISFVASFSLLINTLGAPISVLAQEDVVTPTPEPTIEATVAPTESPTEVPTTTPTPEVTVEPTPIVEESTPIPEASQPENQETANENAQSQAPPDSPSPTTSAEAQPTITPVQPEEGKVTTTVLGEVDFSEVANLDGTTTITTDKADYSPTDTVVISATGLTSNKTYQLLITSVNNYSFTDSVTAGVDGSFVYLFTLDGTYRPDYLVEVKDGSQVVATVAFTDAPISGCTNDTGGVNDLSGQKDLTKMCVDYAGLPNSVDVNWNWDDTAWQGNNSGDACSLYDTNGDGNVNYALCVIVKGSPATYFSKALYSCGDDSPYKCTQPLASLVPGAGTTCTAMVLDDDPFNTSNDTQADCTVDLDDVDNDPTDGPAVLVDVCSYPSQQPNSDPSDCILFRDNTGRLEVVKDLVPTSDLGLFNLQIDGAPQATDVGDGGTTGEKVVTAGIHTVGETAGTGTSLTSYASEIVCRDLNGTGLTPVASGTNAGPLNVTVDEGDDIVCTITNTLQTGTIVVHKDVQGPVGEDITDTSQNFTVQLDGANSQDITDGGEVTYNDVVAGAHTITESTIPTGYVLYSITSDGQITVVAGDTTHVYIVNRVEADPELGTFKTRTSDATALEGETVTFEIEVENTGNVTLYNVVVSDIYDYDYLQYVSSSPIAEASQSAPVADASDYDGDGDTTELISTLTWEIGDLAPGASYTLTLDFEAIQFTDDTPVTTYTGNEAWAESCLEDTVECSEENTITTETSPAVVDIDALGEVSGFKFVDADGEGDWDGQEGTLAGVTVNLYDNENNLLASTVTGSDGSYSFINLATGNYKVCEGVPTGYSQTFPSGDGCHSFSITDNGEDIENKDFGNRGNLSIFGYKYEDENGDGTNDSDWTPVEGLLINLWKWVIDQFVDTGETDTTDVNGYYEFLNLEPGTYQVSEYLTSLGSGWTNITPTVSDNIALTSQNAQHDFVNTQYGSIRVVKQTLPDGSQENFEFSASYHNENFLLTDGFSDLSGDLLPGTYSVSELPEAGWDLTSATCDDGSDPSSIDLSSGEVVVCTFTNTQRGHIIVEKEVEGTDAENEFNFTISDGDEFIETIGFVLGDGDSTDPNYSGLPANTYIVSEEPNELYTTSVECVSDQEDTESADSLDLNPGETITCTFTNTRKTGNLTIHKIIDADGDLKTTDDQTDGEGWYFGFEGASDDTSSLPTDSTNSDGLLEFEGVKTGTYNVQEVLQPGYNLLSNSCADGFEVSENQTTECTFINTPNGVIHGIKWNDLNGNSIRDCIFNFDLIDFQFGCEPVLSGWTIFIDENENSQLDEGEESTQTDGDGWYWFTHLFPGTYRVCEVQQAGWNQTYPENCHNVEVPQEFSEEEGLQNAVFAPPHDFGNQEENPGVTIEKSNDKSGGASAGNTVNYTLVVTNTGNQTIYGLDIIDILPGGFTYVSGTTSGVTTSDPSIAGSKLTWENVTNLAVGAQVTLSYQVTIASDLTAGIYKNFATCEGFTRREQEVNCNEDDSSATVGGGQSYGGNLPGQVLGASTELPATGSPIWLLLIALTGLTSGLVLRRKYEKN